MNYPKNTWDQLKNLTTDDLIRALKKDNWELDVHRGAEQIFRNPDGRRVSIHYHPHKTYGPKLIKSLLDDIGWPIKDMRRLNLIK